VRVQCSEMKNRPSQAQAQSHYGDSLSPEVTCPPFCGNATVQERQMQFPCRQPGLFIKSLNYFVTISCCNEPTPMILSILNDVLR
jgi:hypothetical protein